MIVPLTSGRSRNFNKVIIAEVGLRRQPFTELGPGSSASLERGGMARSFHVAIAIASMNRSTEAIADPLYSAPGRSDVKRSTCPDQYPSNVDTLFGATGDDCSDDISRLEAFDLLGSFGL